MLTFIFYFTLLLSNIPGINFSSSTVASNGIKLAFTALILNVLSNVILLGKNVMNWFKLRKASKVENAAPYNSNLTTGNELSFDEHKF